VESQNPADITTVNDIDPAAFAREWVDAWNRRDLEAILAHYAEDVRFVSPTAARVTGNAVVVGKSELRAYWTTAVQSIGDVKFVLEYPLWDPQRRRLAIVYARKANGSLDGAVEFMHFRADGLIDASEAMYGALASRPAPVA
jgi:hypothetical protein